MEGFRSKEAAGVAAGLRRATTLIGTVGAAVALAGGVGLGLFAGAGDAQDGSASASAAAGGRRRT